MMNKKGSVIRTFLYIIFISIIVLLIYSLYVGIKEYKKQPDVTTSQDVLKSVQPTDYNPLIDITSYYMTVYQNADIMNSQGNRYWFDVTNTDYYYYTNNVNSSGQIICSNNYSEAKFYNTFIPSQEWVDSTDFSTLTTLPLWQYYYNVNTNIDKTSVNNRTTVSQALVFNCDIPVEYFNFKFVYHLGINSSYNTIRMYYVTDTNTSHSTIFTLTSGTYEYPFYCLQALNGSDATARKIIKFGFFVLQDNSSTNRPYYLPQYNGSTSYSGINYNNNLVFKNLYLYDTVQFGMNFFSNAYSSDYLLGYDNGYNSASGEYSIITNSMSQQITDLNSTIISLRDTITNQGFIISHLQDQINNSTNNFKNLFFTFADVPLRTVSNMLGFDVFGFNLFQFFIGLITALGMIWLVKKFV